MSYITSTWLGSQYAQEWAISSIFVDMREKRIERNLGTTAFLLWGGLDVSRGGGVVGWLLLMAQCECHAGRLEAVELGKG